MDINNELGFNTEKINDEYFKLGQDFLIENIMLTSGVTIKEKITNTVSNPILHKKLDEIPIKTNYVVKYITNWNDKLH